jgi:branched-chain amino acid transport system substrate-binding protein
VAPAAALLLISAAGCGNLSATAKDRVYTVGVVTSQTGGASQLGIGELRGARLAAEYVNAHGGINGHRLKLITADDQSNPQQAVLATRRMIGKVDAIIGSSVSGDCNAMIPLTTSAHVAHYCLSPGIKPKPGSSVWSASAHTVTLAERAMGYWKNQSITRIGLIYSTDASGEDGAAAVRKAVAGQKGMLVTADVGYDPTAVSITSQLQKVATSKPQALVLWSTGAGAGVALKGISQMGLDLPVVTTNGNATYAFVQRIADYMPKTLLIPATQDFWWEHSTRGEPARSLEQAYHRRYHEKYGEEPDFGPGVAYDAMLLVGDAMRRAGGTPGGVRRALERETGYPGVVGTYRFGPADHRGLTIDDVAMVRVTRAGFSYVGR